MDKTTKKQIIAAVILLIFFGSSIAFAIISAFPTNNNSSSFIDGIPCSSMEELAYHIHAHLDIFVDGQYYVVPSNIGVATSCIYWLHTHDSTGIIHIEAPSVTTFKLGQFLDIWGNSTVNVKLPEGSPTVYINGNEFSGDYRNIPLNAYDEIAFVYGTAPSSIPSSYDFPAGL